MDAQIDVRDIEALARQCRVVAAAAPGEFQRAMTRVVIPIEADAKRVVPTDTHHLQRSITHEVTGSGTSTVGRVGTNVPYGRFVEEETRPHWPPVAAVAGWARRHSMVPFLVARAISRRGTKARPYLKPALQKNLSRIDTEFTAAIKRLTALLGRK